MWARATRLEFVIVSVALLVLLMCSNPPRSGTAGIGEIRDEEAPVAPSAQPSSLDRDFDAVEPNVGEELPAEVPEPPSPELDEETGTIPEAPKVGAVDARSCDDLEYQNVMYGQVTVRWVWNGTKFVPHKVCVVEEENGVSSVWSFDQQDRAVLSELSGQTNSSR